MHVMPGEIKMWPATVLPTGWLFCHGQTLDISAYTPLYNIIGTRYGGDGVTYFRLPDYRNRLVYGSPTTEVVGSIAEVRVNSGGLVDYTAISTALPTTSEWSAICYGGGIWLAVSYSNPSVVAKSTDGGKTWSQRSIPGGYYKSLKYGNGVFVALAQGNTTATSTDGESWTLHTHAYAAYWSSMDFGNGDFIAVAVQSNQAIKSVDGVNWTPLTLPSTSNWNAVCHTTAGDWVALTDSNVAARTTDATTWTSFNMPANVNWMSLAYGNGRLLAVGLNGGNSNTAAVSTDNGVTWTLKEMPESALWFTVTFGNGIFVVAAYLSNKAISTVDGDFWTSRVLPASSTWYNIAYGDGVFNSLGYGTADACQVSGISNNAQTVDVNFIISYTGQVVSY